MLRQPKHQIDRSVIYWDEVAPSVARLLSLLDRELQSSTYGSFDREHWGWKFRDFPITTLQASIYPLSLLYARFSSSQNALYRNPKVLQWTQGAIENTLRRQHTNGSFDSVGPQTQDHGVTLAVAQSLCESSRLLNTELPANLRTGVAEAVRRSCQFALKSREDYAFISNHQALFALAFLNAYELLGDREYLDQAEETIDKIILNQSADGWYLEYEGPDPGYESLGISYLATYWNRTGSERLLKSLRRSIEFLSHCIHPDGSIGGVYGSRHTSLYFPAGFEILSGEIAMSASIACFMSERLVRRNVVTPGVADAENLPPILSNYLLSCLAALNTDNQVLPELPCETLHGLHHFTDSQITVVGTPCYYAVTNSAKGGLTLAFDKTTSTIAYQDAGYVIRQARKRWTSQLIGLGRRIETSIPNQITCTTRLAEVRQEVPTPLKFILLRVLNLTLFRSLLLGAKLRSLIIKRLITKKLIGPWRLQRSITFGADEIHFCDELIADRSVHVDDIALSSRFTAIHMGSAKYFHPSELESLPIPPEVREMPQSLNQDRKAHLEFSLRFSGRSTLDKAVELDCQTSHQSDVEVLA